MTESTAGLVRVPAELPEVRILRLEPGDVLVLQHEARLSAAAFARIRADVKSEFPDNRCMVLDDGITLDSVLRKVD